MSKDLSVAKMEDAEINTPKNKPKTRGGRKRKRQDSESSSDMDDLLPENSLEVEKNLHASALKNNLDDVSVKKILKKVVTNDHVLALVKLREQEEAGADESSLRPKLTRAKMKELLKDSPAAAPWSLELTPIVEIPVKTRPEVSALIAHELHADEDDEEYKPTVDDVPSDDDQTLESCSDVDSQPRTPATPGRHASPKLLKDGPFKVPQNVSTARKKLILEEEEATIALRTRSKLSLSETPIESIESSFVPPDDLPLLVQDEVWSEFLNDCLNPASVSKHEDDDEADPEYNVAADADANDEDEALESNILKISRKELNDLVTELFNVMPEAADDALVEDLTNNMLTEQDQNEIRNLTSQWEGKQEPVSDDETNVRRSARINFEKRDPAAFSIGKAEADDPGGPRGAGHAAGGGAGKGKTVDTTRKSPKSPAQVTVSFGEQIHSALPVAREGEPPVVLRGAARSSTEPVRVRLDERLNILPEQLQILQQQLRQHVQLAATNYLQLYVHPVHWARAPAYKQYLEQLNKMVEAKPDSVAGVCNLRPAVELAASWERSVSEDTPENKKMVEFIQKEVEKCRRCFKQNNVYRGEFPPAFCEVVANSAVFLYPYLLPAAPYRADNTRRFSYRPSESELIVLGLDQFWQYVEDNPQLFELPARRTSARWGLVTACELVCRHMLPWLTPRWLRAHIHKSRKDKDSPIYKFFATRTVKPVQHKLLPFNPQLTLYEQPAHEMPRIWLRYLSRSSKRFRDYFYKRKQSGQLPSGCVDVEMGDAVEAPPKAPLPIDFTKQINYNRLDAVEIDPSPAYIDKFDLHIDSGKNLPIQNCNVLVVDKDVDGTSKVVGSLIPCKVLTVANNKNAVNDAPSSTKMVLRSGVGVVNNAKENAVPASRLLEVNPMTTKACVNVNVVTNKQFTATNSTTATCNVDKVTAHLTATPQHQLVTPTNMYRMIQNGTGAFLVPFKFHQTNTVDSMNTPIISSIEKSTTVSKSPIIEIDLISPDNSVNKVTDDEDHCRCCIQLRKICKQKQTFITDFFKTNSEEKLKKCECSSRVYPRVSKRLKMLVRNYKSQSWSVYRELQSRLRVVKKEEVGVDGNKDDEEFRSHGDESGCDLEDIAAVTSYQLKLTIRSSVNRNIYLKRRVNNIFCAFDPDFGDALRLAGELARAFGVELVDMFKEFVGFLTAEQADRVDQFRDHFTHGCVEGLLKRIDQEVQDKDRKRAILSHVSGMVVDSLSTSCELCSGLLSTMDGLPKLAKYAFSLFPHRSGGRKRDGDRCTKKQPPPAPPPPAADIPEAPSLQANPAEDTNSHMDVDDDADQTDGELTICDEAHVEDCQADGSSCGEDDDSGVEHEKECASMPCIVNETGDSVIKSEEEPDCVTPEPAISKTEDEEDTSNDISMLVISEGDPVKTEPVEWKRDEDKLILEELMQYLTPQERKDKTILEVVEETNVYAMIAERLKEKSVSEIRERVVYLLEILVLSDYS